MKQIILNEFKSYIRNPFIVTVLVIFPIAMIFILGNLVEKVQVSDKVIGEVRIAYSADNLALEDMILMDTVHVTKANEKDAVSLLKNNEADAFLAMDVDGIRMYEGSSVLYNNVIKAIMNGLLFRQSVMSSIAQTSPQSLRNLSSSNGSYTETKPLDTEMSMFDYYVIAMTIMTATFSCLSASMAFTDERKNRTMNRLITSPMHKGRIFLAKCLGQIPFAIIQVGVVLIFSGVVYHTQFASTLSGKLILFLLLTLSAVVSDIAGVVISLIFRRSMAVFIFMIGWVMLLFSGCFAKAMTLEPLCNFLPPYRIRCAAFELNLFGNHAPALKTIGVELLLCIAMVAFGGLIFSKKQEERV